MNSKNSHIKKRLLMPAMSIMAFGLLTFVSSCEGEDQVVANLTDLVIRDEFGVDGVPDTTLWTFEIGRGPNNDGWGNQEEQYYTNRTENVTVQNGNLLITAIEEEDTEPFGGAEYTSARLITKDKFEQAYGRFEARIRLPYGQGIWPAFWMLGADIDTNEWPDAGEIDIMEYRGEDPTIILGSVHGPGYSGGEAISKSFELENDRFDTGFHVFGVEWAPDFVNYYVDGFLYNQITPDDLPEGAEWVFDKPFFILINLAVGGEFLDPPNEETVFPQTMLVDYVRVYQ